MISIIAAVGKNNELGKDNDLIWHIKEDLRNFKNLTMGKYIVMGANTYKSLPKRLEGRKYIVLSKSIKEIDDGLVYRDFEDLLKFINKQDEEVMVIGGETIYKLFVPYADRLYLTEIDSEKEADVYFPSFNKSKYNYTILKENNENDLKYKFVIYEKKEAIEMKKGKLIVFEGTDCSGKETQVKRAVARFKERGINVYNYSFPMYDTPTGRIVGGPYLGKMAICEGWFPEGAASVDALTASAYYAADRRYNIGIINNHLENGDIVILDRYVESNMAHQGGKLKTPEERAKMYQKLDTLEFEIMELPRPDAVIFLYMPFEYAAVLKKNREETPDQHESNKAHLKQAEAAYLELTEKYGYKKINCVKDDVIRTIEDINDEVVSTLEEIIK